ncbi:MAG: hypothetical protein Q4B68_09670, partial [Bacteroidales bacterium]|nr:hypothetical protein [Bacteroidales bacterium]
MKRTLPLFAAVFAIALMAMAPQKSWAQDVASVTIADATTNYSSINDALAAAIAADTATMKLLANVDMPNSESLTFSSGKVTLDLNGKTLSAASEATIIVAGGKLFITDFTEAKEGKVQNAGNFTVKANSGTLAINAGTYTSSSALNTSSSCNVSLSGGRFKGNNYAIYTPGKSALAPGFTYVDASTGVEVDDNINMPICNANYSVLFDVIVKKASTKAIVTIGDVDTEYLSVKEALAAAMAPTKASVKLMADYQFNPGTGAVFDRGDVTLDLNGHSLSTNNSYVIHLLGGALTIKDSSEAGTGLVQNNSYTSGCAVNAGSGKLNIEAGTYIATNALYLDSDITCALSGGRFKGVSFAIYTYGKSALAPGYGYFDTTTGDLLEDATGHPIFQKGAESPALDITVQRIEVPTAITDVTATQAKAVKMIENGQVVIIK